MCVCVCVFPDRVSAGLLYGMERVKSQTNVVYTYMAFKESAHSESMRVCLRMSAVYLFTRSGCGSCAHHVHAQCSQFYVWISAPR